MISSSKIKHEDKRIDFPNFCQSLHVGFNKYLPLKSDLFKDVY